jgi:hypothetical protein
MPEVAGEHSQLKAKTGSLINLIRFLISGIIGFIKNEISYS